MASKRDEVESLLDAISARVEECRAAAATAGEGDPDALKAIAAEVDGMAQAVAELKAAVSAPSLGGA